MMAAARPAAARVLQMKFTHFRMRRGRLDRSLRFRNSGLGDCAHDIVGELGLMEAIVLPLKTFSPLITSGYSLPRRVRISLSACAMFVLVFLVDEVCKRRVS